MMRGSNHGGRRAGSPGDTLFSHAEFTSVINLAKHVVAVSRGDQRHMVTVRDVTFAEFILELIGAPTD